MQAYDPNSLDSRTFGDLILQLLKDLNKPNLQDDAPTYLRDAIRYFSRQPFLFSEIDNASVLGWQASLYVPQGYTILATADNGLPYIFVNLVSGLNGTGSQPVFDHNLFTTANAPNIFQPAQVGTTVDGAITWATIAPWPTTNGSPNRYWTQLSTVPMVNQYAPPVDYVAPYLIEVTAAGLRVPLYKRTYSYIRGLDVIRPAPITVYPTDWTFFQEQIYTWPYPNGFYPLTLSYYTAPFPPVLTTDSNFWTTRAERMIRKYASALIQSEIIRDDESAAKDFAAAKMEERSFQRQASEQNSGPIPPSDEW